MILCLCFQSILCLFIQYFVPHTSAVIIPLPAATIFPSGSVVPIVDQSFNLQCTGTGTLRWYRGFNFDTPLDRYTQLIDSINNTLSLTITLSGDQSGQTNERSRTYFCTANNSLGVARSQSVLIPFFQGFGNIDNARVTVRLGQAVALLCNVTQRPTPTIVWYKNDAIIQPNTVNDTNPKYILLDDGQHLVIYDLVNDDITATYKCGVINVVNPQISSNSYNLYKVDTIPGGIHAFIAYRRPIANQFVTLQQSSISYFYIAATNGDIEINGNASITRTSQDLNLLRVRYINALVSTSGIRVVLNRDNINLDVNVFVGYTIVEPLSVVKFPSVVNVPSFRHYESENISFTCRANGTDVKLRWYFNGLQLDNNNETLILNDLSLARTGVYQCLWEGFFDNDKESVSWALSVQNKLGLVHNIQSSIHNCYTVNITWNSQYGYTNRPTVFYHIKIYDDVTGSLINNVSVYDTSYQFVDNDLFTHRYTYVINEVNEFEEGISTNNTFSYQRIPTSAIVNTSIEVLSYTQDMIIVQFQIPIVLECVREVLEHVNVSVICNGTNVYSSAPYIKDVNNIRGLVLVPQYQKCNISIVFTNDVGSSQSLIVPLDTISSTTTVVPSTTSSLFTTTQSFPTTTPSSPTMSNSNVASAVSISLLSIIIISLIIILTISVVFIVYKRNVYRSRTASLQSQLITTSQSQLITTSSNQFHAVTTNVANSEEIPWPGAVRVLFRESVPTI